MQTKGGLARRGEACVTWPFGSFGRGVHNEEAERPSSGKQWQHPMHLVLREHGVGRGAVHVIPHVDPA
jgi:hypothetical protein